MKKNILALLPYAIVLAIAFYVLPLLIKDTGMGMLMLLLVIPLLTLICAVVYGIRQGFDFLLPVTATILFVPTIFIFYNTTAWVYIIVYAVIALVGNGIGRVFHKTTEKQKMNKKRIGIAITIVVVLSLCFLLYTQTFSGEYVPADDEIALHIQLDTKEDVGLLVFDYCADEHEYSGGISNADGSLIKRDSDLINVWKREELNSSSDSVELSMQFRIITEYVDPNYENIYPEDITKYIEPISWKAQFGESYFVTVTGDKINGYEAVLNQ